jgi:hypothetical protein
MSDVTDDTVGQVNSGLWLTIVDAARHFGVATRTIERRIQRGELQRRPSSFPVEVWVPGATEADVSAGVSGMSGDAVGQEERAVALVERVSDSVARQFTTAIEALERSQARNAELERENGVLSERAESVRQSADADRQRLEAERDAERAARERVEAELKGLRALPWWRRLFG